MTCFTLANKITVSVLGVFTSIILTVIYFLLLFTIRIDLQKKKELLKKKEKIKYD